MQRDITVDVIRDLSKSFSELRADIHSQMQKMESKLDELDKNYHSVASTLRTITSDTVG